MPWKKKSEIAAVLPVIFCGFFGFGFFERNLSLYEEAVFDIPCVYRLTFHMSYQATTVQLAEAWEDALVRVLMIHSYRCFHVWLLHSLTMQTLFVKNCSTPTNLDSQTSEGAEIFEWAYLCILGGNSSAFFSCIAHPSPGCAAGACVPTLRCHSTGWP